MEVMKSAATSENQQQIEQQMQQFEGDEGRRKSFHVLAVDDSNIERKILEKLLALSSYQVTSVESGDKALEYLGLVETSEQEVILPEMRVSLIMTDYSMPGMSGYDLLKRLKGSTWRDVPVIVMSSENVPSRINMCLEEGAEEFLLKPVRLSDLTKLHDYVKRSTMCCCPVEDNNVDDSKIEFGLIEQDIKRSLGDEYRGNFGERKPLVDTVNCSD